MFIKNILKFLFLCFILAGCNTPNDWNQEYAQISTSAPLEMRNSFYSQDQSIYGSLDIPYTKVHSSDMKNISVLLPLSGANANLGKSISKSIELAFLQKNYGNVSVTFFDLSGNRNEKQEIILAMLAELPDIIIGPIFAEDARMLRDLKPAFLPVLTFSSDIAALGNGVMSMALFPTQSVEAIIKQAISDKATKILVLAPKSQSGNLMASAAVEAANIYDLPVSGLFFYDEGNTENIKKTAERASMWNARTAANVRAKEILSDMSIKESLTASENYSVTSQLEKISKSDTLGKAPYDAVLFLGNTSDSKNLLSFLRYYDVGNRDVALYATALWDTEDLLSDFSMSGTKFAALNPVSESFNSIYEQASGIKASRLDSFGFDAANITLGMIFSSKYPAAYLLDPSGYKGLDGLIRLRPNGENERALQIIELTGTGTNRLIKPAALNFINPIYIINQRHLGKSFEMPLASPGINPMDYIKIPQRFREKYTSKTYGANIRIENPKQEINEVVIITQDDEEIYESVDFEPATLESIDRQLIDDVEISE